MSLKKRYLKSKPICKVTFSVPSEAAPKARSVHIVGEFNNWSAKATPMKKLKNGNFTATVDLEKDNEYEFRYLIDKKKWENDWEADKYQTSPFGDAENSVVVV